MLSTTMITMYRPHVKAVYSEQSQIDLHQKLLNMGVVEIDLPVTDNHSVTLSLTGDGVKLDDASHAYFMHSDPHCATSDEKNAFITVIERFKQEPVRRKSLYRRLFG